MDFKIPDFFKTDDEKDADEDLKLPKERLREKAREGIYDVPQKCPYCSSTNIQLYALITSNDAIMVKVECFECGMSNPIAKKKNAQRARGSNLELRKWIWGVREKRGDACEICGSIRNIEVHHIIPVSHAPQYSFSLSNGVVLCKDCHYLVHHKDGVYEYKDE